MDESVLVAVNAAFHTIGLLGLSSFVVLLYGRENSLVHTWPRWRSLSLKAALSMVCGGHLLATFNDKPTPIGEILLNGGLAVLWVWAAVFHYQHFLRLGAFQKRAQADAASNPTEGDSRQQDDRHAS